MYDKDKDDSPMAVVVGSIILLGVSVCLAATLCHHEKPHWQFLLWGFPAILTVVFAFKSVNSKKGGSE